MAIDLDQILPVTVSGLRDGEQADVVGLVAECALPVEDLSPEALRHFIVARRGTRPIGAVGLELTGAGGVLRSLSVKEPYRHRGVADRLVASAERYALSHGLQDLYLLTVTAVDFFAQRGYIRTEQGLTPPEIQATQEFSRPGSDSARCLQKHLST